MAVDKKFIENGKVNYDRMNEDYHRREALKARKAGVKWKQEYHTKEALALRAKQDRKAGVKKGSGAVAAVERGIKDANIASMVQARRNRIDRESGF